MTPPNDTPTFEEWLRGRRFKKPQTGNRVLFPSLEEPEQERVRARWKSLSQNQDEETRPPFDQESWDTDGWLREASKIPTPACDKIPTRSLEDLGAFTRWIRENPDKLAKAQEEIDGLRRAYMRPFEDMRELYHGASPDVARKIDDEGFALTKGLRSGLFGDTREVDNKAVFLADRKDVAHAFGANKSRHGDAEVLSVRVGADEILDMRDWNSVPPEIASSAMRALREYEGTELEEPSGGDFYWLIDQPEVVDAIKSHGYQGVWFPEDEGTLDTLGVEGETSSLAVFDPRRLHIPKPPLRSLDDIRQHLLDRRENTAPKVARRWLRGLVAST